MFESCKEGNLDRLKLLVEASKDKNPRNPNSNQNDTLLHQAARNGHLDIIEFLVPLLDEINPKDKSGLTPLHYAAANDHVEVVKYFCKQLDDKNPITNAGWTLLHYAAMHGQANIVEYLVSVVDDKNPKFLGKTPLDYARLRGHTKVVKVLQGSEVKPLEQQNRQLIAQLKGLQGKEAKPLKTF